MAKALSSSSPTEKKKPSRLETCHCFALKLASYSSVENSELLEVTFKNQQFQGWGHGSATEHSQSQGETLDSILLTTQKKKLKRINKLSHGIISDSYDV